MITTLNPIKNIIKINLPKLPPQIPPQDPPQGGNKPKPTSFNTVNNSNKI